MDHDRRDALRRGGAITLLTLVAAAGWLPRGAAAETWNKDAFSTKSLDDTMKALRGSAPVP